MYVRALYKYILYITRIQRGGKEFTFLNTHTDVWYYIYILCYCAFTTFRKIFLLTFHLTFHLNQTGRRRELNMTHTLYYVVHVSHLRRKYTARQVLIVRINKNQRFENGRSYIRLNRSNSRTIRFSCLSRRDTLIIKNDPKSKQFLNH